MASQKSPQVAGFYLDLRFTCGSLVEVDRSGKIVRSIGGADPAIQMGWTSGFAVLPEGGILINDYTGRRIIEVDAKGKVVNQWRTGSRTIASIDLVQ